MFLVAGCLLVASAIMGSQFPAWAATVMLLLMWCTVVSVVIAVVKLRQSSVPPRRRTQAERLTVTYHVSGVIAFMSLAEIGLWLWTRLDPAYFGMPVTSMAYPLVGKPPVWSIVVCGVLFVLGGILASAAEKRLERIAEYAEGPR